MEFYSYLWLREDGTPYYAGKGKGNRAYKTHGRIHPPKDRARTLVFYHSTEVEAFVSEKAFIKWFGRKDLGTGCLRNLTDGGDGVSGLVHSEAAKKQISAAMIGHPKTLGMTGKRQSEETKQKIRSSNKGQVPWIKGRHRSEETKQKISRAHQGMRQSETAKQKISATKRGKPWSAARRKVYEDRYGKLQPNSKCQYDDHSSGNGRSITNPHEAPRIF